MVEVVSEVSASARLPERIGEDTLSTVPPILRHPSGAPSAPSFSKLPFVSCEKTTGVPGVGPGVGPGVRGGVGVEADAGAVGVGVGVGASGGDVVGVAVGVGET